MADIYKDRKSMQIGISHTKHSRKKHSNVEYIVCDMFKNTI